MCLCVYRHVCMLAVPRCAAQDKVQFKLQLSGSLWKSLCYPVRMVSSVAVKPCCAEFNTHERTHAYAYTYTYTCAYTYTYTSRLKLNDPGSLIWPIHCHISSDTLPLWSLVAHKFFHLYRVIILSPLHTPANLPCSPPFGPLAVL